MYKLIRDGVCVGMTETLNYIKQAENGCFNLCPEPEASGIVFDGTPYHLRDRPPMTGADTVDVEVTDAGAELQAALRQAEDIDSIIVEQEYRLTLLELGLAGTE